MSKIESMKAELEAAKYDISGDGLSVTVIEPKSGWQIDCSFYSHAIEIAYAYLQREKKFAAMEALLKDMLGNELYLDTDDRCHPSTQLMGWIRRAEELLK